MRVSKPVEFLEYIQGYMVKYALKRVHDLDMAEDIVQSAWAEALKTLDFSRSDGEVRDYLIQAVALIIGSDWKRTHATGTGVHDKDNLVYVTASLHSKEEDNKNNIYLVPYTDPRFEEFDAMSDFNAAFTVAFARLRKIEQEYVSMVVSDGLSKKEAAIKCGHSGQWGFQRFDKLKNIFKNLCFFENNY